MGMYVYIYFVKIIKPTKTKLSQQMDSKPIRNITSDVHLFLFAKYVYWNGINVYIFSVFFPSVIYSWAL